ncbi:TPA: hypothetical protein DCX16_06335 [bacterium]|nr:hypothetical protein [bacterium]
MKTLVLFFGLLILPLLGEAKEGECKNPIFLSAFEIDPNLLIILDNSDSMNLILEATIEAGYTYGGGDPDKWVYDPNKSYPGKFAMGSCYSVFEDGWYVLGEREPGKWIIVYLVKNDYSAYDSINWRGHYQGNYLNWLLGMANTSLQPWKTWGSDRFYKIELKRTNPAYTPEPPRFIEDLVDPEDGGPFLREPLVKPNRIDYYWFDPYGNKMHNGTWTEWYRYWYRKPASRMNTARYVVNDLIRTDFMKIFHVDVKLQYGLMVFRKFLEDPHLSCDTGLRFVNRGGELLAKIGSITTKPYYDLSHLDNIEKHIRSIIANEYTPLAETVYEAGMYLIGSETKWCVTRDSNPKHKVIFGTDAYLDNYGVKHWCQDTSILLITDGFPTYDTEVPPLKGNYPKGELPKEVNPADLDFDGDGYEPPMYHENIRNVKWNVDGVGCAELGAVIEPHQWCSHYLDDVVKFLGGSQTDLIAETQDMKRGYKQQRIHTYIIGFAYDLPFLRYAAEADKCSSYTEYGDCVPGSYNRVNYFALRETDKRYFSATSPKKLKKSLSAIIQDIIERTASSVAVAVSISTSETRFQDHVVRARFNPRGWVGYLEAFKLPYSPENLPVWEGGERLGTETADSDDNNTWRNLDNWPRNIYTCNTNTIGLKFDFKKENISNVPGGEWLYNMLKEDPLYERAGRLFPRILDVNEAEALVSWISGEYRDEDFLPNFLPKKFPDLLKERMDGWRLFDIVYSTPLVLGVPNAWYGEHISGPLDPYRYFVEKYEKRERMVFVGSNDGLLHAFSLVDKCGHKTYGTISDCEYDKKGNVLEKLRLLCKKEESPYHCGGWEKWVYIPSNLLPYLRYKADPNFPCRFSGVDAGLVKTDIRMHFGLGSGVRREWGSVLVGGEREGGSYYFCLNITDSTAMINWTGTKSVIWEYSDRERLGDSMSCPEIGIIKGVDKIPYWVAFLTTSINNTSDKPYIIPLNITTGKPLKKGTVGLTPENEDLIIEVKHNGTSATLPLTSASAVDDAYDGMFNDLIDVVYFGDSNGRVWKMTVGTPSINTINGNKNWEPYPIFQTKKGQPISVPIAITFTKDYKPMLFFGTGRYEDKEDIISTYTQTLYCLIDRGEEKRGIGIEELKNKKIGMDEITNSTNYWYHKLDEVMFVNKGVPPLCVVDPLTGDKDFRPNEGTRTTKIKKAQTHNWGWYLDLNFKGCDDVAERITESCLIYGGILFFTSFIPTVQPCEAGGYAYLHAIDYLTGDPPSREVLKGTSVGDMIVTGIYLGKGVPSRPVIDPVGKKLLVQMSDEGRIKDVDISPGIKPVRVVNWGEEGFVQYHKVVHFPHLEEMEVAIEWKE